MFPFVSNWLSVSIGSDDGLVLSINRSGNNPLPELVLTNANEDIWRRLLRITSTNEYLETLSSENCMRKFYFHDIYQIFQETLS